MDWQDTGNESPSTGGHGWSGVVSDSRFPQFLLLCFAVWLHAASSMLAATTLPSAIDEIGGGHLLGWAFSLYQLGSICAGAATALVMVRLGLRKALVVAATVYGMGSGLCALAPEMAVLLSGRLVQGVGGGCLLALVFVAINRLFAPSLVPRLFALISAVWSVSAFCGPLVGGTFSTIGFWRFAYWAFAIQSILFVIAVLVFMERGVRQSTNDFGVPFGRLGLLVLAVLSILLAGASVDALRSPVLVAVGVLLFAAFLRTDARRPESRMFPDRPFRLAHPTGAGQLMVLFAAMGTMSFLVYGPLLLEYLYGVTPLAAGYILALESVGWGGAALLIASTGRAIDRQAIRCGMLVVTAGTAGLALFFPQGPVWAIIPWAVMQGAGFGMMWGFMVRRVVNAAPVEQRDVAATSIPTTQQIGFAVGAASTDIVANAMGFSDSPTLQSAQSLGFWIFAVYMPLLLLACFAAWRLTRDAGPSGISHPQKTPGRI